MASRAWLRKGKKNTGAVAYTQLDVYKRQHPISRSIREAYGKEIDTSRVQDTKEMSGRGVQATIDGKSVCVGNDKWMEEIGCLLYTSRCV